MNLFATNGVSNLGLDILFTVIFLAISLAVIVFGVLFFARYINVPAEGLVTSTESKSQNGKKLNITLIIAAILAIGFLIRLIFTFLIKGYRDDFRLIYKLIDSVSSGKFANYYANEGFAILPVTAYIYALFGSIGNLFSVTSASAAAPLIVKLPLIICDLASAYLIYRICSKYANKVVAIVALTFVMVFPPFIFASSVWGTTLSIVTFLLILSFYFLVQKNIPALIGAFSLALLSGKEAIFVLPVVAVFVIYSFVKAVKIAVNKKLSFNEAITNSETRAVLSIPLSVILSTLIMYLITLPMLIETAVGANFFGYINSFFISPLTKLEFFGYNALSIFNLFGRNGTKLDPTFPAYIFSIIFAIVIIAIVVLIYLYKKNRANLVYLGAYVILTLSIYFINSTVNMVLPALMLMFMSFILIKDKRILHVFSLVSIAMLFNGAMVMTSAGYLNNAEEFLLSSSNTFYTGTTLLNNGFFMAASIIASVITIFAHLYATLILLDVSMGKERRLFKCSQRASLGKTLSDWFKK